MRKIRQVVTIAVLVLASAPTFARGHEERHGQLTPQVIDALQNALGATVQMQSDHSISPLACSAPVVVTCNTNKSGNLGSCLSQNYYIDLYTFSGTAGQTLRVTAQTTTSNYILVAITDSSANVVASDYDVPSVTVSYTLTTTGTYYIGVGFLSTFTTGPYTLSVTCPSSTTPPPPSTCSYTAAIRPGQSISGQLTSTDTACGTNQSYSRVYKWVAMAGDAVDIQYSANYPVSIEVVGPDKSGIWRDETASSLTTSYIAPTSGNVAIWLYSNTMSPVTGSFTLQVTPMAVDPCKHRAVKH